MPHFCAAINCGNKSYSKGDLSFFRFPVDVKRCKKWVINTRRADLDSKTPEQLHKSYVLCSTHFEDSQFANVLHKRLNWNAVPTLFDVPNPPAKLSCARKLPMRMKEITSSCQALQDVTSKDTSSLRLSIKTDRESATVTTAETGSNIGEETAALLSIGQQLSVPLAVAPHNTPVKKEKTECETTTVATTEPASTAVTATATLLKANQQLPVRLATRAPQTPVIKIIRLMPRICQLQSQSKDVDCKKVVFKTGVMKTLPMKPIQPVQVILAAPSTYKAVPDIAQDVPPKDLSFNVQCRMHEKTEQQSAPPTSTTQTDGTVVEATAAVSNVDQRRLVSRKKRPPDTLVEKQLKQKIHQLHSQLWRKNRKIEALKTKVAESQQQSTELSVQAILEAAGRFLTPVQLSLFRAQLLSSQKEKNGYRWSLSDKIFALQLLYKSAEAFRFASQHLTLPSETTLKRFVAETLGKQDSGLTTEPNLPPADLETDDQHPE